MGSKTRVSPVDMLRKLRRRIVQSAPDFCNAASLKSDPAHSINELSRVIPLSASGACKLHLLAKLLDGLKTVAADNFHPRMSPMLWLVIRHTTPRIAALH